MAWHTVPLKKACFALLQHFLCIPWWDQTDEEGDRNNSLISNRWVKEDQMPREAQWKEYNKIDIVANDLERDL